MRSATIDRPYSVTYDEHVDCPNCGCRWQLIDWGCALHRLTCEPFVNMVPPAEQRRILASAASHGAAVRFLGLLLAVGLSATAASAQTTPKPGVDCSLLTPTQALGQVCGTPPKSDLGPPLATVLDGAAEVDCTPVPNPYAEPDRAARCAAWDHEQRPTPALPTFTVGGRYVHAYPHVRMVVIAVGLSLEGVPVVTGQYTAGEHTGNVFAFRIDQAQPWRESR